jgi:uncharacterized protein (TIGR04255 family)
MAQRYKRPPITEAVIEIRLEKPLPRETIDRIQKKLLLDYPAPPQQTVMWNVEVGEAGAKVEQHLQGHKLTSGDGTSIVIIGMATIATSRLAPYEGWESFVVVAKRNWKIWKGITGHQRVARIGVRYINRLDIPVPPDAVIQVGSYLNYVPSVPSLAGFGDPGMDSFAMNSSVPLGIDECKLILNSSSVPSPLVNTASFILDLDVSRTTNVPQNDEAIWSLLETIRAHKNNIFESCITDEARALFS